MKQRHIVVRLKLPSHDIVWVIRKYFLYAFEHKRVSAILIDIPLRQINKAVSNGLFFGQWSCPLLLVVAHLKKTKQNSKRKIGEITSCVVVLAARFVVLGAWLIKAMSVKFSKLSNPIELGTTLIVAKVSNADLFAFFS